MRSSALVFLLLFAVQSLSAQFPVKIPKIAKPDQPKTEKRQSEEPAAAPVKETSRDRSNDGSRQSGHLYYETKPTNIPVILKDDFEIRPATHDNYWKFPNQSDYSSWIPDMTIGLFYDESAILNYEVTYFNPDGSEWFKQKLEDLGSRLKSADVYEHIDTKSTNATGVFSFTIVDRNSGQTVYKGKFRVGKYSRAYNAAREKNKFGFFVDYDWMLPFGVVGFKDGDLTKGITDPVVRVWLKGKTEAASLEARLFYNGAQIGTTADKRRLSVVTTSREFEPGYAPAFAPEHIWKQWQFTWSTFLLDNGNQFNREDYKDVHWLEKNPGEYVVKIYNQGKQIRELKFLVGNDGRLVVPAYSDQVPLPSHRIVVPVKITDAAEKWNAASWKTDAFFGNPLNGFNID